MKGKSSFYLVIKFNSFPNFWCICGVEESKGRFQSLQKSLDNFQMPNVWCFNGGIKIYCATPSANYLLIPNDVIRLYVRSIYLKYIIDSYSSKGCAQYFFANFENDPFNATNILVIRTFRIY